MKLAYDTTPRKREKNAVPAPAPEPAEETVIKSAGGGRFLDELIKITDSLSECMILETVDTNLGISGEGVSISYDKRNIDYATMIDNKKVIINVGGNQLTYYIKQHKINRDLDDTHKYLEDDEVRLLNNVYDSLKELIIKNSNGSYNGMGAYEGGEVKEVIKSEIKKTVNKDAYLAGLDEEISEVLGKVNDNEGWLA